MVKKVGKFAPEAKLIRSVFAVIFNFKNFVKRNLILGRILRKLALQGGTPGYKKNEPVWPKSQ